ncbi:MAG: anthranilate phosphoribosyltransferase [Leptospiraceae bacterium]|nr:anthranilate phosphoribosyltransferase [Leptospiraceae bacterium]MDW7975028.1 anthranilate phosphoribosyltransferase [Leptospiraceae bacterium]
MVEYLKKVMNHQHLTLEEAYHVMNLIMTGEAGEIRTAGLLVALAMKKETGEEIEGFAKAMRKAAVRWPIREKQEILDTCGTGGDNANLLNISTISAVVMATMGYKVAKHGNRAVSSATGSADVLEDSGINLEISPDEAAECLEKIGITFLFAPKWHPAMKYAAPVRRTLGVRTIFNILGPITNPAPITHQIMGVFSKEYMQPIAEALCGLGRKNAYVIHSHDGLDEVSVASPTDYVQIEEGKITRYGTFNVEDFGIKPESLDSLRVKDREESKQRFLRIIQGEGTEVENKIVAINTAIALILFENLSLKEATEKVWEVLKSGKVYQKFEEWRNFRPVNAVTSLGG